MIPKLSTLLRWHRNITLIRVLSRVLLPLIVLAAPLFALAMTIESTILLEMAIIITLLCGGLALLYGISIHSMYRLLGVK